MNSLATILDETNVIQVDFRSRTSLAAPECEATEGPAAGERRIEDCLDELRARSQALTAALDACVAAVRGLDFSALLANDRG